MSPLLPAPLALVCHDAGAAQLILPWLPPEATDVRACLQGPARALWLERHGARAPLLTLEQALAGAALLLSGTSLEADLEHTARLQAAAAGLRSVAVVDHWVHYAARFQRDGLRVLPDELWVCDAEAFALARAVFPERAVRLQPNLHLRSQLQRLAPCPDPLRHPTLLLLAEPQGAPLHGGPAADEQAFDYLLAQAHRLGLQAPLTLRLRAHDDDPPGRWTAWLERQQTSHDAAPDRAPTLEQALERVAWVVGLESTALVLAAASGRRAVCAQPPWLPRSRLPQRSLIHLRDLAAPG